MKFAKQSIPDVILIEPNVFRDNRGFFLETFREDFFSKHGIQNLKQYNQSRSSKGVLRGLHYQTENAQGKLVRCSQGKIFDVAVDIRINSKYYGQWVGVILDDHSHKQLWIPPGFAHGFLTLSSFADVCYSCSEYYSPNSEKGIIWNDKKLAINWPLDEIKHDLIISDKDKRLPNFYF
jgi:dTDP-4-dehydrorhamnose 3,5-epimerase